MGAALSGPSVDLEGGRELASISDLSRGRRTKSSDTLED